MVDEYNPFKKTALYRAKPSKPLRILLNKGLIHGNVIDVGCGWGYDYMYLQGLGYYVDAYDKFNPNFNNNKLLNNYYDTAICSYMFNVIKDLHEHQYMVDVVRGLGDDVYICLRNDRKAIKSNWEYDGINMVYKTSTGSYQRYYTEDMISSMFGNVKYIEKNSSLIMLKLIK